MCHKVVSPDCDGKDTLLKPNVWNAYFVPAELFCDRFNLMFLALLSEVVRCPVIRMLVIPS
jgi:hypothetical protein